MTNRDTRALALLSTILVFCLLLPASAALEPPEGQVRLAVASRLATGPGTGDLPPASAPSQHTLNISSTIGGSVTVPGEGIFTYDKGTVVELVAEPDEGYVFVNWTGDVSTVGNVNLASTSITMDGDYSITANFLRFEAGDVGVKAGDWIKITYNITGLPPGQRYAKWLKLEFLSVEGPVANIRATLGVSDGTTRTHTATVNVVAGSDFPLLPGIIVPANQTAGDSVYVDGYGNVTVEGEVARTIAGANRTVLYASLSQNETRVTYYWDKLTGVMVGKSSISPDITATGEATETNMWGAPTRAGISWWPWIVVAAGVVAGVTVFFVRRRGRVPAPAGEVIKNTKNQNDNRERKSS